MVEDVFGSLEVADKDKVEFENSKMKKAGGPTVLLEKPPHMSHWVFPSLAEKKFIFIDQRI